MLKCLILLIFANLVLSYTYQTPETYFSNEESSPLISSLPYLAPPPAPVPEPAGSGPDLDALYGPPIPYSFSHSGGGSSRSETSNGRSVTGSYSLQGADGIMRVVHYVADGDGFRASVITNEPGTEKSQPAGVLMESSATPAKELSEKYTSSATASNKFSSHTSTFVSPLNAEFSAYPRSKTNLNYQKPINIQPNIGRPITGEFSGLKSSNLASRYSSIKSPVQAAKDYRYTSQKVSTPVKSSLPQSVTDKPFQPAEQFEPVKTAYTSAPSLPPQPVPVQPAEQFNPVKATYASAPSLPPQPAPVQPAEQFEPVKTAYTSAPSLPPQPVPVQPAEQFTPVKATYASVPSLPSQRAPIQKFESVKANYNRASHAKTSKVSAPLQTYQSPVQRQQAQQQAQQQANKEQTHFSFQSQVNHLQPVQPQPLEQPKAVQPIQEQYAVLPQAQVNAAPFEYYQISEALAEVTSTPAPVTTLSSHFGIKGSVPSKQSLKSPASSKQVVAQIPQLGRKAFRNIQPFTNDYKRPVDAFRFKPSGPVKSQAIQAPNPNPQEKIREEDEVDHATQDQSSHGSIVQDRTNESQTEDQGF